VASSTWGHSSLARKEQGLQHPVTGELTFRGMSMRTVRFGLRDRDRSRDIPIALIRPRPARNRMRRVGLPLPCRQHRVAQALLAA
jgi:hypothetical protein